MIPVAEARARILQALSAVPCETVALSAAHGRTLGAAIVARLTQPPFDVSAMDGYAARSGDVAAVPARLRVIGAAAAGDRHHGAVGAGETVRIFTGAPLPPGADTIVIQENVTPDGNGGPGDTITVNEGANAGRFVRPAGLDFRAGDDALPSGRELTARDIGLAAAMNHPWVSVRRRPRIALLATGDEVVQPGDPLGPNQIVSSNVHALAALVTAVGGIPINLGIARDDRDHVRQLADGAAGSDLLVTTGGASVGDHDLMREVLGDGGRSLDFWRIAMRPGKPLMFGRYRNVPLLGLPGNPVSALVCGVLFLIPAIRCLLGHDRPEPDVTRGVLGCDLPANDRREDYLRSRLDREPDGRLVAFPFSRQDSSMMRVLTEANGLTVRAPNAPAAKTGTAVDVLPFPPGC